MRGLAERYPVALITGASAGIGLAAASGGGAVGLFSGVGVAVLGVVGDGDAWLAIG